jgi:hypothetical protein
MCKFTAIRESHAASERRNFQMDSDVPAEIDRSTRVGSVSACTCHSRSVRHHYYIIGVREFLYPGVGALGFGVPLHDPHGSDLLAVKAVRDVVSGILSLRFLGLRNRKLLACAFCALALISLFDGVVVLRHAGWSFKPVLLVH